MLAGYPTCKFIAWDLPAPILCPKCKGPMKMVEDKDGNKKYVCTNNACKTVVVPEDEN